MAKEELNLLARLVGGNASKGIDEKLNCKFLSMMYASVHLLVYEQYSPQILLFFYYSKCLFSPM